MITFKQNKATDTGAIGLTQFVYLILFTGFAALAQADESWGVKVGKMKDEQAGTVLVLETELAKLKLELATIKESSSAEAKQALSNVEMQSEHVKDVASLAGDLKQKLFLAEQERDSVKGREAELIAKAKAAVESRSKAELDLMSAQELSSEAKAKVRRMRALFI